MADTKDRFGFTTALVIAPSNIAGITARRALASDGGVVGLNVMTLSRFAETLAIHHMGTRRPATRVVIAAAWRRALAHDPGVFADVASHPTTVAALLRTHDTLRDLDPEALDRVALQPDPAPDLVRLHRRVTAELATDWYDITDLLAEATRRTVDCSSHVVLQLPGRLTNAQSRLVEALREHTRVDLVDVETHEARDLADRVLHASDSDDEVRLVIRHVMADLQAERSVAVFYSDRSSYARLVNEHLAAAGVTTNGPGARPVLERATTRAFLLLLDLVDRDPDHPHFDFPRQQLFEALGGFDVHDFDDGWIHVASWERASREAGVVSGDDWDVRLTAWIESGARWDWQREDGRALLAFVTRLRDELRRQHATWHDLLESVAGLFATLIADEGRQRRLAPEEQHACATLLSSLRALSVLDSTPASPSMRTLHDLLEIELDQVLPRVGRFGDGVYVGPVSTASGLSHDVAYVVGLSEDLYPGSLRDDVLLPDRIRSCLNGALPMLADRIDDQRRALQSAFASAETVIASFPRGDLRQTKTRIPSRWLLPTLRILSGEKEISATTWQDIADNDRISGSGAFASALRERDSFATEQEWQVRAACAQTLEDEVVDAGRKMLEARSSTSFTRFDGNLAGSDGLIDYRTSEKSISPSALEQYAGCPHAFFVQRMLGVHAIENPEDIVTIPPNELGSFIHECMELLVKTTDRPGAGEPWTAAHRERLLEIADEVAVAYERRGVTGHSRLWTIRREKIAATLLSMLEEDSTWRASQSAAVHAAELEFGTSKTEQGPVSVPVPSGGRVLIRGSADKIDVTADRILVTDIKTGSKGGFSKIKQEDPVPLGAKLQLPAYALAAREQVGDDRDVTALYWFVHKESGRTQLRVDESVIERYGAVLDVLTEHIAAGVFPHRPPEKDDFLYTTCPYCSPDGMGYGERRRRWADLADVEELSRLLDLIERNEIGGEADSDLGDEVQDD